jgi:transposase, IS5 family
MKANGKLDRNWPIGAFGDAIHAVLRGARHNPRMMIRKLHLFYALALIALIERAVAEVSTS